MTSFMNAAKVLGKFLERIRRAKNGAPKFFACGGLFFIVETLKTVKFSKFIEKSSNPENLFCNSK